MSAPVSPSVSVVICCYNHSDFLVDSLNSVRAQTVAPVQLVITDDASSDDSVEKIKKWTAEHRPDADFVLNETNVGLPATLNRAVPLLHGDFVVIMSADDLMVPKRLELQLQTFSDHGPSVGMTYSDMVEIDEFGEPTGQNWFDAERMGPIPGSGDLFETMAQRAFMAAPTVMTRRETLSAAGPYDESLMAEDYDMFLRLSRLAEWAFIDEPLVEYRVLSSSLSRSTDFLNGMHLGRLYLLRKHVGATPKVDQIIANRISQISRYLYIQGRSARSTATDLRFALSMRRTTRDLGYLAFATCRVPGPVVGRATRLMGRMRDWAQRRMGFTT